MKYLLVLLLLAVVVWRWRQAGAVRTTQRVPPRAPTTTTMVACKHCAVHLPASDAVPGRNGSFYCSPQHRQLQEP